MVVVAMPLFIPPILENELVPVDFADARAKFESLEAASEYSFDSFDSGDLDEAMPN